MFGTKQPNRVNLNRNCIREKYDINIFWTNEWIDTRTYTGRTTKLQYIPNFYSEYAKVPYICW